MDNLSGFDPSTMTYLHQIPNVSGNGDPFQEVLPPSIGGPQSPYGYALYVALQLHVNVSTDVFQK